MRQRHAYPTWTFRILLVMAMLIGCAGPPPTPFDHSACPVSRPVPENQIPPAAAAPIVAGYRGPPGGLHLSMVGNEALWVTLPPDGVVRVWDEKFLTVRLIPGRLTADVQRLDGPAPTATVSIPEGYGDLGFQAFGVMFPAAGCWQITQHLAGQKLRFVVDVRGPS